MQADGVVAVSQGMSASNGPDAFSLVLLSVLIVIWVMIANVITKEGGSAEMPNRMAQLYGYTVCLIAIMLILTSVTSIVNSAFDRAHPLEVESPFGPSLVSFDAYRATRNNSERMMMDRPETAPPDTASEETLLRRYNGLVETRKAATMHRTTKDFVSSGLLLAAAVTLFAVHWRWLGRISFATRAAG